MLNRLVIARGEVITEIPHRERDAFATGSKADQRNRVAGKHIRGVEIHAEQAAKFAFAEGSATVTAIQRENDVRVSEKASFGFHVHDEALLAANASLEELATSFDELRAGVICGGGRDDSGSEIHRGEQAPNIGQHGLGHAAGELVCVLIETAHITRLGELLQGHIDRSDLALVERNGDCADNATGLLVHIGRLREGRGGDVAEKRNNHGTTFRANLGRDVGAECGQRSQFLDQGLESRLAEQGVVECGSHDSVCRVRVVYFRAARIAFWFSRKYLVRSAGDIFAMIAI